jgi:LacI family transcriptional regulator
VSRRRVTLADVARAAEVSRTTASLVLSERGDELRISPAVQERVREVAAELGYRPNAVSTGLRSGTSRTLAFVSDTVATSQLAGDMIKGALAHAHRHGYMLFIGETEGDPDEEERLVEAMLDRQVDGFVIASMFTRERALPAALDGRAAVLLNALPAQGQATTAVVPDEYAAGQSAARLLLEAGHRRIHLIGAGPGPDDLPNATVAGRERLAGILATLSAAGVAPASGRVCADWLPEHGREATHDLLRSGVRAEAVITFNDRLAFGAYQALQESGLAVPEDMSVVSFDDHQLASWLRPGLTTFALPHDDLGARAIELVLAQREGGMPGEIDRLPMPLRTRGSVAPAR